MSDIPSINFYPFSTDLWQYLDDLPYMPSRVDRDALIEAGEERRTQIWDYFFRIRPEDVGIPQREEIQAVRNDLDIEFRRHQETVDELEFFLRTTEQRLVADLKRSLTIGTPLLVVALLLATALAYLQRSGLEILLCSGVFGLPGAFLVAHAGLMKLSLNNARQAKEMGIKDLKEIQKRQVRAARMRINTLEQQIEILKKQLPEPPTGSQVREWLNTDLVALHKRSIEQTGLESRLVPVEEINQIDNLMLRYNPIPVMGPGELQDVERIPPTFTREINADLNKHLSARSAYILEDGRSVDVLFGVYYIKYIGVTDDMLATYSLFYDFITGKYSGESVSEQYYRDVVAITTTRETRHIMLGVDSDEYILVEDAPTFTIYLAGTEERRVTFVNENYFHEIRDKLGLETLQIPHIYWVGNIDQVAGDTVKLLRHYLPRA